MKSINVQRSKMTLLPDRARVLIRPFQVSTTARAIKICSRILALPDSEVKSLLTEVMSEFDDRHHKIHDYLKRRCEYARRCRQSPWS